MSSIVSELKRKRPI